ncbi:MAG: glycosyltransferase family 2 protein [Planctomycetota bacterium]
MAKTHYSITAFCPCYNDAGTIASMVLLMDKTLSELTDDYEVIVVDDGSSDHSRPILRRLIEQYPRLRVIFHERNKGYGGALRSGFGSATKDLIFYTDGDFQYDVTELKLLLPRLGDDIDVVNGYKIHRSDPLHRKVIGRIYHHLMRLAFGFKLRDVDCDFRLIRRSVFDRVTLTRDTGVICVEMIKRMQDAGVRFAEVPVHHFFRSYGVSQFFNFRRLVRVATSLVGLWLELVWARRRVHN